MVSFTEWYGWIIGKFGWILTLLEFIGKEFHGRIVLCFIAGISKYTNILPFIDAFECRSRVIRVAMEIGECVCCFKMCLSL